jgi:hypothetical protein
MSTSDDDDVPTAQEVEAALGKVTNLVKYLRHNAIGWDDEGEKAEARKFRKLADKIEVAAQEHDLTALRKLTGSAPLIASEQLTRVDLDPLFLWARR